MLLGETDPDDREIVVNVLDLFKVLFQANGREPDANTVQHTRDGIAELEGRDK